MSGPSMAKQKAIESVLLTPEMAVTLLEHNTQNRPLRQMHVNRIARAILDGRWEYNGDTIKIADNGDVLDGQHRCWAVVEAQKPVETIIVRGIAKSAFNTIDTIRQIRNGADMLSLAGVTRHRNAVNTALVWLLRWQSGEIEQYKAPKNRIENAHIEAAFAAHPRIVNAVERARKLRDIGNVGQFAFLFYLIHNRDAQIAERMMATMEDPSGAARTDPFFKLRQHFLADKRRRNDVLVNIALTIKAANAAKRGNKMERLIWVNQGTNAEKFPKLAV